MNMLALFCRRPHDADVFAVFIDGIAGGESGEGDFVTERCGRDGGEGKFRIILRDDAKHVGTSGEVFDNNNADIVLFVVNKQMRG